MNESELLAELDTYFTTRSNQVQVDVQLGNDITYWHVKGALLRANSIVDVINVNYFIHVPSGNAFYDNDTLGHVFELKMRDYINVTQPWIGAIHFAKRPRAVCRVIRDPLVGEEWILVTETAPDMYNVEDITGTVMT